MTPTSGFYVHYKGGIYFVQGIAKGAVAELVVYESVQGCGDDVAGVRLSLCRGIWG